MTADTTSTEFPVGQRITLTGHFDQPVVLEEVRPLGSGFECRVRLADGALDETVISSDEAAKLRQSDVGAVGRITPVDPERLRLLIESARIRLAYAHDEQFAVSLSGIRTLPHQIEAVYERMLRQPRLRFLLADDPHRAAVHLEACSVGGNGGSRSHRTPAGMSWASPDHCRQVAFQRILVAGRNAPEMRDRLRGESASFVVCSVAQIVWGYWLPTSNSTNASTSNTSTARSALTSALLTAQSG